MLAQRHLNRSHPLSLAFHPSKVSDLPLVPGWPSVLSRLQPYFIHPLLADFSYSASTFCNDFSFKECNLSIG